MLSPIEKAEGGVCHSLVKNGSFTKSPRGNKGFDLQEPFGMRQFHKTTKEKVLVYGAFDLRELLARDSFTKPQKEKFFGL